MNILNPKLLSVGTLSFVTSLSVAVTQKGPSTTTDPYLKTHLLNTTVESILTVDDGTVTKTGGGTTELVGIPDGIGVIDGDDLTPAEPGFFYLLVNHELNSGQGATRDHGSQGAFVSKWKINKTTHEVVEGDDLIKEFYAWNGSSFAGSPSTTAFTRMCSSDLPARTAIYNSVTGNGSQEFLYFNGEETSGGRVLGHVVTGVDAGKTYHLAHLGYAAIENVVLCPFEQDKTIAVLQDDASNGEVYVYVGTKQTTGNEVEKAGLVNGNLYALAVVGKAYEMDDVIASAVGDTETFTLKLIGEPGDRPTNGSQVEARGLDTVTPVDPTQTFQSLKMGGPEDGVWDTRSGSQNTYYFITKGTSSNSINAVTRLWKLEFTDITNPELGGTMTLVIDGPEARLGSFDNMCFEVIGGQPKLYIQEDLGGDARLSKIWEYDLTTGLLEEIARHAPSVFFNNDSPSFLTTNEESSGIISLKDVLGEGWFAVSIQAHTSKGLSNSSLQVENGQLCLIDIMGRSRDFQRERLVRSGDNWDYRVDGVDPSMSWNDTSFAVNPAFWNKKTDGTITGPQPTPIGYGESMGVLATDVLAPSNPKPAVNYFRKEFNLSDPTDIAIFDLYMKIDDGAVVYINGVEVARQNVNLDVSVDNNTLASTSVGGDSERDWKHVPITCETLSLQATNNVIAVSIHQGSTTSSDLRMDLELIAWKKAP